MAKWYRTECRKTKKYKSCSKKFFYNEILIKMKNLDLSGFAVQEMNAEEMVNVDGGFLPILIAVAHPLPRGGTSIRGPVTASDDLL